ncbi:MAG TPA: hypothetical protein VFH95_09865 [Candidatus Kapabacteria bacterium]|nr:hypothetical protein [Candidatus Kapabacteria bacterium]
MSKIASKSFFALFLAFFPVMLSAQWHELPGPSAGSVNDFCEIAGSNGGEIYAATNDGVYRTMDHAKTWQLMGLRGQQVQKITQYVTSNPEILLAIVPGELGLDMGFGKALNWKICRSDDSARTWDTVFVVSRKVSYQNYYAEPVYPILGVLQEGNDVVVAVSGPNSDTTAGIYRSTDIGHTWLHQALAPNDGVFFDFTIGGGSILGIATDTVWSLPSHGTTWQPTSYPNWHNPLSLKFFGKDLFVGGTGRIDISTNNGVTWLNPANVGLDTNRGIISTFAVNGLSIVAAGGYGAYRSTDGGSSWITIAGTSGSTGGYPRIYTTHDIEFFDGVFYAATVEGVFTSLDGISWTYANDGIIGGAIDIACFDSTLFATTLRGVFRSTDRGQTWSAPTGHSDLADSEAEVLQLTGGSLYVDGGDVHSGLWRWDDSGWNRLSDPLVNSVMQDTAALFVATVTEGIIRSLDRGMTWTPANSGIPLDSGTVQSILAVGETVLAFMQTGSIYSSIDEGIDWSWRGNIPPGLGPGPGSAVFVSGKVYAACDSVYISIDTGASWTNSGVLDATSRISLWPLGPGVVAAASDGLYLMDGTAVKLLNDSISAYYFDAFASDDSLVYVATNLGSTPRGKIYAESLTSLPLAVTPSPIAPASLSLSIFPNPSNGVSTIAFSLPRRENISLKLFDERGVKVAMYFNGIAGPGEVQVPVDVAGLPAGSYIAVLTTREGKGVARVAFIPK